MFDYRISDIAVPDARVGELTLNGKTNPTPTHFSTLTRPSEPDRILETFRELDEEDEPLLPHIGGFVVESHMAPAILDAENQHTQSVLGGNNFTSFDALLDDLGRFLLIDPNTDRLLYWLYRQQLDEISEYLPTEFTDVVELLELDENDTDHLEFEEAYPRLREQMPPEELVTGIIDLQEEYDADLIFSPYIPIGLESYEEDLNFNLELYWTAQQMIDKPVAPVIPLKTSVLGADAENDNGRIHGAEEWIEIIQSYRELDPIMLFLKATNARTDPDTLHKTDSEGIYQFFDLLRRFTNLPAFFLGLDEFSYILMQDGLDGYSHPIYKNPYRMPVSNGNGANNHSSSRKFIVPRRWGWEKFDQLNDLGCNCVFCQEYNHQDPAEIELSDQDALRTSHWLWLKDEELREINEAIEKDQVRPGLQSICHDSEWKKNFTTFL